jgi:hypothetical protein
MYQLIIIFFAYFHKYSMCQSLLAEGAILKGMKDMSFNTAKSTTINRSSLAYVDLTQQVTPDFL